MIHRIIKKRIVNSLKPQKVIGLFGARRTGKTVLMKEIAKDFFDKKVLLVNGEDLDVAEILSSQRIQILKNFLKGYEYLFIDEAQKIPNIGLNLKLIVDSITDVSIFITGSSAIDLKENAGEPLTGRSLYLNIFPITQAELNENYLVAKQNLESRLVFGSYPQVITANLENEKKEVLESIKNGYLLKDILSLDNQKDSMFVLNLLRLIAFQIGNTISYSELASNLNVNTRTVQRYLRLLEKTYILFSLPGFSRNLRKEYSKTPRYYFGDNGIRNSLVANFNKISMRDDVGKLWENYCVSERLKILHYSNIYANHYYWRTYDQKEIDLIEEKDGFLTGFEFKWKEKRIKQPKCFLTTYKNSDFNVINRSNYLDFIVYDKE